MTINTTSQNPDGSSNATIATVASDGGRATLSKEEVKAFKDELSAMTKSGRYLVHARRWAAERTRQCIWEGQSPDGRKHRENEDGKPAFPFEGASDVRLRLADQLVNERVLVLVAAALRNLPTVRALDAANAPLGTKLTTLLKWVLKNQLGAQYLREVILTAQYQEGDSPAGAVMGVWWEQEYALEMAKVTREELAQILTAPAPDGYGLPPEFLTELDAKMQDPANDAELGQMLTQLIPTLRPQRAKSVVAQLRESGTAEFPRPYRKLEQPCLVAYRLFEDIFFPPNTTDLRRKLRWAVVREWVSEVELRERIVSGGYTEAFVEEVLKHEAKTMFPEYERKELTGEWLPVNTPESQELHKGEYELLTVLYRAVNDEHIPGLYAFTMHHQVEEAATDRELLGYAHGDYPLTGFFRETLSRRLLDSRGVPELAATEQTALKLLADSFNDNVSLATLPNIKVPRRRSKLSLVIKPLGIIKEDRPGDVAWMTPPQYPMGNDKQQEEIRRRVDLYWGRISENVPPLLTQLHQNGMVTQFLANLGEALKQMLQLCQQYMPDDVLAQITGDDGQPIAHSRAEIEGAFTVELSFDAANMDMAYFKDIAELVVKVLGIDILNVSQRDQIVQWLFSTISPTMGAKWVRPVEAAQQSEITDEENNFTKISAGIEPPMVPEGLNFPLRLQVLQGIPQKNPEAFQKLTPMSREIYLARLKYLENQVQQLKNAQIGRQVGQPALGQGGPASGISAMQGN